MSVWLLVSLESLQLLTLIISTFPSYLTSGTINRFRRPQLFLLCRLLHSLVLFRINLALRSCSCQDIDIIDVDLDWLSFELRPRDRHGQIPNIPCNNLYR
jgi:hypothetical protein